MSLILSGIEKMKTRESSEKGKADMDLNQKFSLSDFNEW